MMIQPKPAKPTEPVSVRFPADVLEALDEYCQYLGGASDRSYVIVEAVKHVMARDRGYQKSKEVAPEPIRAVVGSRA